MIQQKIVRVRRNYNKWVSNQTIEDFSLRFTAKRIRKWSPFIVANTALGSVSFLALESIGASITLQYGYVNATIAILVVCFLIFATGLPISYYAAKHGVDIDLLSRGAGFGYIGSTITSLIYASFTFIFFAIEAAIMSTALELFFGIPLFAGYLISSIIIIPMVVHGFTFINKLQLCTQPIWLALHILPFAFIAANHPEFFSEWTDFTGLSEDPGGGFNILLFGAASAVIFSLAAQIGEQVDFLRFLPPRTEKNGFKWWWAMFSAGPGWIGVGGLKIIAGSFLVVLALKMAVPAEFAGDPSHMYQVAFQFVFDSPVVVVAATALFVIISQIKINVTNAYAGSIAWSNFFSRLTHSHPGRVAWLVFNVTIAFLLITLGVYRALEQILGLYSIIAVAWVGALSSDLLINKPLGLSPSHIEFRRAYLYDINPVGVGSVAIAIIAAIISYSGLLGEVMRALSSYLALGTAFCAAPLLAFATRGKYYLARDPEAGFGGATEVECCICVNSYEIEDMAECPIYDGSICSLCCSLDARCNDACKKEARYTDQILALMEAIFPKWIVARLNSSIGHYIGIQFLFCLVIGGVLGLVYLQTTIEDWLQHDGIQGTMWQIFFILVIISGVATWLFVLARESAKVAQDETSRQTYLLSEEIEAHKVTDVKLQKAKEAAEAANSAKSRYVVGLNHEFRTPLNTILGYSQLLERDGSIPAHRVDAVHVIRRSSEHLTGLVDGLLDISKIESEHFTLNKDDFRLETFLLEIVEMFRLEAAANDVRFEFKSIGSLPLLIRSDEKRLRQVLINILSNAFKFTPNGDVTLSVLSMDDELEFSVRDNGVGILPADLERIFIPFERAESSINSASDGIGLGLAITKILTERMGGTVSVESQVSRGSEFKVTVPVVAGVTSSEEQHSDRTIIGYRGKRLTVIVTDDEPAHCKLISEILEPIGFIVLNAANAEECLRLAEDRSPDMFLLDVSMPGMNGLDLTTALREGGNNEVPIIMITASAIDPNEDKNDQWKHDDYLMKPIEYDRFLEKIESNLNIEWFYEGMLNTHSVLEPVKSAVINHPPLQHIAELKKLGKMGHIRGIQTKLDDLENDFPDCSVFITNLRRFVNDFHLSSYMAELENTHE
ncbi:MAG: response regulator [Rhodospirillales bacterium]|nr:response regulator [Rhodospirillales bacterium]